jgi:hypothetical protein
VSVPVAIARLREEVARFGVTPYLLTVTDDGRPHAVSVTVAWEGDELTTGAGAKTMANVAERQRVSLLWPPVEPGGYSLIVDGLARVDSQKSQVAVEPAKAVLHRARADVPGSDCVAVFPV